MYTEWKAWAEGTEANAMRRIKELEVQVHNEQTRAGNADLLVNQLQQAGAQLQRDLDTAKQTGAQLQYDLDTAQQAVIKLTNNLNTALQRDHPDIMPGIQAPVTSNVADQNRIKGLVQEVIQLNQLLTELGNGDAKDRWQDALGHVLKANQTLKKAQSAVDRDGVTYPQFVQILMEATICEQDFDSIANFIDDKTWRQLFQHLRQAYYTMERVMDTVKSYRLGAVATADGEKMLQVFRADRKEGRFARE